ncbi:hypothetical protein LJC14_06055 [Treponema sp. OttesenSCG-928-L16]|nr:hypothetical protein [Treponema sp. OttesenSCG-928-L16]
MKKKILFRMQQLHIMTLDLCSPVLYQKETRDDPFAAFPAETEESLTLFEIGPSQHERIDPDPAAFLGKILDSGSIRGDSIDGEEGPVMVLPQGKYVFAQTRDMLDRDGCAEMAMEIQKEGLWRQYTLAPYFFLRRLNEDGAPVSQILRPISAERGGETA